MVGIAAIFSDEWLSFGGQSLTANIVTMSVFGALLMYALSMAALFKLRATEPRLARPYKAPFYRVSRHRPGRGPHLPGHRGVVQPAPGRPLRTILAVGYGYFQLTHKQRRRCPSPSWPRRTPDPSMDGM